MKNLALTALLALGVAVPSIASAMDSQTLHNDRAAKIFAQFAEESRDDD
ncbi:MAG: hypothetical protein QNJ16_11250 [Rhodobacter sp.]|nr:hypothetical protein [Rhodobacter sp.]MDJ0826067.1 hypothetical protein [Rhodobacter sp.]